MKTKKENKKSQKPPKAIKENNAAGLSFFKAAVRLRITGLNQTRLLNALNKEINTIKNIKRISPKVLELTVLKRESKKTFAILQKMCYDYTVLAESGGRTLLASCIRHVGFAAGALVFGAAMLIVSQTVWKIEITGNELVDELTLTRSLKECGVTVGAFKAKLDADSIAAALRKVEGVAAAAAELRGTTVYIRVLEEKQYTPPVKEETFRDIVSKFDAEITRMSVKSGTAADGVKLGGRVAAGETLIRAERINSAGEVMGPVKAEGSVFGKVAFKETHIFSKTEQILSRKGEKKVYTSLSLFGLNIGKKPQGGGEYVTTESKLFFIPIKVTRTEVFETELISRERDIDACVENLKNEALLNNVIKAGGSEIETVTTLTELENEMYMLNIYISAEILISVSI